MKRLIAFLLFFPLLATASVDITNIAPAGGIASTDKILGVTNANWAALMTVQQVMNITAGQIATSNYVTSATAAPLNGTNVWTGTNSFTTNVVLSAPLELIETTRPGMSPTNSIYMWVEDMGGLPALRVRDWNGLVLGVVRDNVWIGRCAIPGGIKKGDAVYNAGVAGTNMIWIAKAQANDPATMPALGLAAEDIAFLLAGRVLGNGLLTDANTTNWGSPATLYVSDTIAGGLTNVVPVVPNIQQQVGFVQAVDGTNGSIQVEIGAILNDSTGTGQTNWYFGPYGTNVLSYLGSRINGVSFTNGVVYGTATNSYGVTSIATNTLPIDQVTTPGAILTNGNDFAVSLSNAVRIASGVGGINGFGANATNAFEIDTAYKLKAVEVSTNGDTKVSGLLSGTAGATFSGNTITINNVSTFANSYTHTFTSVASLSQFYKTIGIASNVYLGWIAGTAPSDTTRPDVGLGHVGAGNLGVYALSGPNNNTTTNTGFGTLTASNIFLVSTLTATNGVYQMVKPSFTTNFTCTTNLQTYLLNGTAPQVITLPNAANVPNVVYHFSTTNDAASYIITNATGTQTVSDGKSLSYTNSGSGKGVVSLMSDGAHWWLMAKGKTRLPCAQFSTSTNTTFVLITNTITLETTDFNNNLGIGLDNSAWFTLGTGSRIYCTNLGTYMLTISAIWSKTSGSADNGDIWLRQSSIDIPNSMTLLTIPNAATNVMTVNFLVNVVTNNTYFDFQGASTGGAGQLQAMPAITSPFNRPACPSVIVTVNKISD